MEESILKNISRHIQLDKKEEQLFLSMLEHKKTGAKQTVLKQGDVCKHSSFVVSGCLRGYFVDKDGIEHVLSFAPAGWWIADMYSLLSQKPGNLIIEAMQDSELFQLSRINQEKLYVAVPAFERFFRIISENSLVAYQQRLMDNLSLTAQERYLKFCGTYPGLIDTLPQKQVAAYIGVTPEFLSKMKKRIPL